MACTTPTLPVYTPEQVTEITQRYYSKGLLFRRGKLARQMQEIREQCATARAMDDGHKQRETQALIGGVLASVFFLVLGALRPQLAAPARPWWTESGELPHE